MGMLTKLIQTVAKKHSKNFVDNVNCRYDPRLKEAVANKIDKKINNLFSNIQNNSLNLNAEMEVLEDVVLDGFGLGLFDNIIDFFKYGYKALRIGKFKINELLLKYREEFANNISQHTSRLDLRKGDIDEAEINDVIKKIYVT